MSTTDRTPTDDEIEAAIVKALAPTGEEMVRWCPIRDRLPGGFWAKTEALGRLDERGDVVLVSVNGTPWVCLGTDTDRWFAAELAKVRRARRSSPPWFGAA